MTDYPKSKRSGPYRSRSGLILGVCRGLADYFNLSVFWFRVVFIILMFITGFWPMVGLYLVAALLLKLEPVLPLYNASDQEFYNSFTASRSHALQRLKSTYENLDRRLKRMEDTVTAKEFDWNRRFHQS